MSAAADLGVDDVLDALLDNERESRRTLSMVPSENAMSALAKLPLVLDVYHRYFFNESGDASGWHFRGAQRVGPLETDLVIPLARELAHAEFATVRPLSGLSAMALVLSALGGEAGSTVVSLPTEVGGHYATAAIARRLGRDVEHLRAATPTAIDYSAVEDTVATTRPALVYVDQSHALFPVDVRRLVDAVRAAAPDTLVHVDVSHWLGLVFGGVLPNPLECGADSMSASTHKTFPGPQKAIVATNRADVAQSVIESQDALVSSHHFAATLSLGLAMLEFRDFGGAEYAEAIVANTRRFARRLHRAGVRVAGADEGFSAGHQLWIDTEAEGVAAADASQRLYEAGLRVNFLPDLPGFGDRLALRVGLNEATYVGFGEGEVDALAEVFVSALRGQAAAAELSERVAALRRGATRRVGLRPREHRATIARALDLFASALLECDVDDLDAGPPRLRGDQLQASAPGRGVA